MSTETTSGSPPGSPPGQAARQPHERLQVDAAGTVQVSNEHSFTDTNTAPLSAVTGITNSASTTTSMAGQVFATRQVVTVTTAGSPSTGTLTLTTAGGGTTQPTTTLDTTLTTTITNIQTGAARNPAVGVGMSGVAGGTFNITSWSVSRQSLWGAHLG